LKVSELLEPYNVTVEREGKWWIFSISELDVVGQTETFDEVPYEARGIIEAMEEIPFDSVEVNVTLVSKTSNLVHKLHDESGLSWAQFAKLFGLSARTVQVWASGVPLGSGQREQLDRIEELIMSLPGRTPEARKEALFATPKNGRSVFDDIRSTYASRDDDINRPVEPTIVKENEE
jgi:DNA-binding transcriptional regulator YiaG